MGPDEQVNAAGRLCGVTKEGKAGIDPSMLAAMMETAKRTGPQLITGVHKYMAAQAARGR